MTSAPPPAPSTTSTTAPSALSIAKRARAAALALQGTPEATRNAALRLIQEELKGSREEILAANALDMEANKDKISPQLFKRLSVGGSKFDSLLAGLDTVIGLADPVGRVEDAKALDEGLKLYRVSCPIGVLCVIFEARPEAAVQIASLALKSGNAVILKGGSEAAHSNAAIMKVMRAALARSSIPVDMMQLVSSRGAVHDLLELDEHIDLVIPRGSNKLVRFIKGATRIPVLGHADGICAVYIDAKADPAKAATIAVDAKTNYVAACNAAETLLVHRDALGLLPAIGAALRAKNVALRADAECLALLGGTGGGGGDGGDNGVTAATAEDFDTEFLSLTMAVKCVDSLEAAMSHINAHGSHHTDCIVTEDADAAERFLTAVDSAGVYHNASTRFADGFRYGFGAEVGVSTNKIHARGPVGVDGLLTYKYRLYGAGHCVAEYQDGRRAFAHAPLASKALPGRG